MKILFSSTNAYNGTKDTALYRPSAGLLQIYDGITTSALRDLKLRGLFADKIIPNSDTTGVVIRNAADTADVVKVDTANGNTKIKGSSNPLFQMWATGDYNTFELLNSAGQSKAGFGYGNSGAGFGFANKLYFYGIGATPIVFTTELNTTKGFYIDANGNFQLNGTTPETKLDVNGSTTLRDWVYLNNGSHTGDVLGDYRYKVVSGVLTFQKCTTANSVRGNGGWTTVSTI